PAGFAASSFLGLGLLAAEAGRVRETRMRDRRAVRGFMRENLTIAEGGGERNFVGVRWVWAEDGGSAGASCFLVGVPTSDAGYSIHGLETRATFTWRRSF